MREDFAPASDVDVLVEFEPEHIPGLAFFDMEAELSRILGRKVDLHTPQFLSPHFRERALAEAEVQYENGCQVPGVRYQVPGDSGVVLERLTTDH